MRKSLIILLAVALILGAAIWGGWTLYQHLVERYTPERCTLQLPTGETTTLEPAQARNASIIVAVAANRGLPERASIIALATAYQESGLRNIDYGDRDSVGLFQQRPSQGWGTVEEIMDPWYSAGKFYSGLVRVTGWESMSLTQAAQAVQISAFPTAYAKHETNATLVARALLGVETETMWCRNFNRNPVPNSAEFSQVLDALGSVSASEVVNGHMTLRAPDKTKLWAAVNHVMANSYGAGVTEITVGSRLWQAERAGWSSSSSTVEELTATIKLG